MDGKRKGFFFGLYLGLSVKLVAPTGFNGGWKARLKFEIDGVALAA